MSRRSNRTVSDLDHPHVKDLERLCQEFVAYGTNWNLSRVEVHKSNLIVAINKLQAAREKKHVEAINE